jgi:hypothetical protein
VEKGRRPHRWGGAFSLMNAEVWDAFRSEYRDCFEEPQIGAEARPSSFEIGEAKTVEVDLDRLTTSDLLLLTYTEERLLFCES